MLASYRAERPSRIVNNAMKPLARSVARFCDTLARLPDSHDSHVHPRRRGGLVELHDRALNTQEHLIHIGNTISGHRRGSATRIQRSLHQLQRTYRSLQGLMIGVPDRFLDRGDPRPEGTVRHLLQASLNVYHANVPVLGGGTPRYPMQHASHSALLAHPALHEPGLTKTDLLSTLFERSERFHHAMVEQLCNVPKESDLPAYRADIEAWLAHMEAHLLEQQVGLAHLLERAGHHRTTPMSLAHGVFVALGHAEGAMIGVESRFENNWQPMIDLVSAHTSELSRYC
ncbi:hypothetical protein [Variovorax sp. JS1663]|uniref:hypothetical protein n=1 Tax=Variovorax sp. JS1663 TaxID=1851577 RepID=UPI000B347E51|nr:hypothetical protein [Variovorax sp. JS1663]OUL98899.1 hypothetical protein A8M77_28990 [Variovorax sp. JS1663]